MPNSQFNSPMTVLADGTVRAIGTVSLTGRTQDVEIRFLIVQNDVVVEGRGQGLGGGGWSGETDPGQERLEAGPALAIGLALLARKEPGIGFETASWSAQIELERQG